MYENPRRNRQARKKKTNKQKQKKTYTQVECMHLALFIFFSAFPQEIPQTHRQLHIIHRWQLRTRQVMKISMKITYAALHSEQLLDFQN